MTEADEPLDEDEAPQGLGFGTPRPRAPRLTRDDVFVAADAVLIAGGRVTIDRVRDKLGRGSPNTIQEHLETWWSRLGSRLRDIPGREFPELPEKVAQALQGLWNTALDSAYAAIDGKAATREAELSTREAALAGRELQWADTQASAQARTAALEESVALARDQLAASNTRAERLEALLQSRDADTERQRQRADGLDAEVQALRAKLDAATDAHRAERAQLEERHAANEARWLVEIDRGRQAAKETAKEHDRQLKELRAHTAQLENQREELKRDLKEVRAQLQAAVTSRAQAEKRLASVMLKAVKGARAAGSKAPTRQPAGKRRR